MEVSYQSEKRQIMIEELEKEKVLQNEIILRKESESRKQKIIIYTFIVGFILILAFAIIIYRLFVQKKKANLIILEKNTALHTANDEISAQRDEIEAQRDEISAQRDTVVIQRDHIEEQKKEITDSINYAKRIQQAVLPSGDFANNILGEHFILFKPKDIVSGDFYWGTRIKEWLIVTVADCTGHGVPGAFMSMLGVSFLNEIVRKKEITNASEILDNLRESVIEALQQKGTTGEQTDGMDIVLCVLNTENNQLQYSGANNPLYIVTKQKELNVIEPDKQPVSIYKNMKPYTNHQIQLYEGDCMFLVSDGYEDQFGGPKNRKFMSKQLKELFVTIANKPMNEQTEILEKTLKDWKGDNEQIDDITILGLKI
jgi:serine phosphatase RsbU (regulator of sigma subunit)